MADNKILTSPLDSNSYSYITLKNGLRAVLINDSVSDLQIHGKRQDTAKEAYKRVLQFNEKHLNIKPTKTVDCPPQDKNSPQYKRVCRGNSSRKNKGNDIFAVSLCVAVGSLNDPKNAQGLAHLCEHALFLGSKKYHELEALQNFVENYCIPGEVNAVTDREFTRYFLTVAKDGLEKALDMLVDCVNAPEFPKDRVLNEIASIDAEFQTKRLDEDLRLIALLQSFAKDGHPLGSFAFGNAQCFDPNKICGQLKSFWENNYYANFMTLVIKGPMKLPKLQALVEQQFSKIRSTNSCAPASKIANFGNHPFDMVKWRKLYWVIPDGWLSHKILKVSWCMEPELWKNQRTKPLLYLVWLLEQKGQGGLCHVLRSNGLISKIVAKYDWDSFAANNFTTVFTIEFSLTDKGVVDYDEVLKYLFGYIKLLKESGPCEQIFKELQILTADLFHYSSDSNLESPFGGFDTEYEGSIDLVKQLSLVVQYTAPKDIITSKHLLTFFDPQLITNVINKLTPSDANFILSAEDFDIETPKREKWFGLCYKEENPDFLEDLLDVEVNSELKLPPINTLLLETLCFPLDDDHTFDAHLDKVTLRTEGKKAKVKYMISKCIRGYLPTARYNFHIKSAISDPLDAGVDASLATWCQCCEHILNSKLGSAFSGLITCFVSSTDGNIYCQLFGPSNRLPNIFETVFKTIFNLENEVTQAVFKNMRDIVLDSYESDLNRYDRLVENLEEYILRDRCVSLFKKKEFLSDFSFERFVRMCASMKDDMFIYGTLRGCVTKLQSKKIMDILTELPYSLWTGARSYPNMPRCVILPVGERCVRVKSLNPIETMSYVKNHYQLEKLTPEQEIMCDVISGTLSNLVYLTLRSTEQLGYVVEAGTSESLTVDHLFISVHTLSHKFTTGYVDERIDNILQLYYDKFVRDEKSFKNNLQAILRPGEKMPHKDTVNFFKSHLLPEGENYRKISFQVIGTRSADSKPKESKLIPDKIQKFKARKNFVGDIPDQDIWFPVEIDLPRQLREENGYFVTNFNKFTNSLGCYGISKRDPPSDPETTDDEAELDTPEFSDDDNDSEADDGSGDRK